MKYLKTFENFNINDDGTLLAELPWCLTDDLDDEMDDAYDKGVESFHKNYDIDENPYTEEPLKTAWEDGYNRK